ncbi:MAG: xylulose kinase, partial [Deltaproteobacteria bacterium]|nr:xylulose kinase [Deltaproteobacteria bacterium]
MISSKVILAIDHGTSGVKAALVTAHGDILDFEYEPVDLLFLDGGGVEQNPEAWWTALKKASRKVIEKCSLPQDSIAAVCVSSTFSSTVAVDKNGRHLMNCITWMDSRGAPYVKSLMKGIPRVAGYGLFKGLGWIRKTGGGPELSGKDDIAHVLLIKHEYPEVYNRTFKFLGSKDYLNLRLTGEIAASYDSMTLFWVTDNRDVSNIKYDDALIKAVGIDKQKLPRLTSSIDSLGTVKPSVAGELGLRQDTQVIVGSPDHQSAQIGSGAVRDYEGHLYIGTSSWIECLLPFKKTDVLHSIAALPSSIPGKYQCINEQDMAGGCLSFLLNNIILHENEFFWGKNVEDPYDKLNKMATKIPPGSGNLLFTPWLNGERTPVDSTTLRGGLHNISVTTTADHIARAILEGVAYNTKWSLGYVEKFVGKEMDPLRICGGGAQSDVWCQIFSDVLGRTIKRVENPRQANARGA